ncbi:MAG TPA: TonB-dependent receptor [Gemmatimonadales bacterium]|nr:TonB-dependent receptor [Gemmatimonadales bacterium]
MRRAASLLAVIMVLPVVLFAQAGSIRGRVTDAAGAPLARASISAEGSGLRAESDEQGRYEIRDLSAGTYTVRVRILGYVPQSARVTVGAGGPVTQDFRLVEQAIALSPVDVTVGSRARHSAAEELAVPVDVFTSETMKLQGATETGQILQALSPSVNFPHQSVTDATDIVRPFTLRGLAPDHTLVLVNGWRRHQTALVNTFAYGTGAGSSGVDLNAIPSSAVDRIEVLRDGASAQYGSDAIAGVVNMVLKEGQLTPFLNTSVGQYSPNDYRADGTTVNVNGGFGFAIGRGSLGIFGEFLDRQPTNRAWADIYEDGGTGVTDSIVDGQVVIKRNPAPQPSHHWGDGLERDLLTMANLRLPLNDQGTTEFYSFGGYSYREGTGNGYRRCAVNCASFIQNRTWSEIFPLGYLPEFAPRVTDYSIAGGVRAATGGWSIDIGTSYGFNRFDYRVRNTLNVSLGPCLDPANPCAPGPDSTFGTGDEIANQTSFFAGRLERDEVSLGINATKSVTMGLPAPVNVAVGAAFRREGYQISRGELASYIDGNHLGPDSSDGRPYSQVFPGFRPADESNSNRTNFGVYADLETNLSPKLLANVAGRFEDYSDFGSLFTGKGAVRFQPSPRFTVRAAVSTGFRAPGLGQSHFSHVTTNVIGGVVTDVLIVPVGDSAARLFGSKPLQAEKSVNLSAGFAFSPSDNVTLTVDAFQIRLNDRILLGATFDDSVSLALLAANGFTNVGGIQYFTNGLDTRTQGLDLTADLRRPLGTGTLNVTAAVNYTRNKIVSVDPLPAVLDTTPSTEPGIIDSVTYIGITEERPDWRGTLTGQYSSGRFHSLLRASYYGKFSSAQPGFCDLCRERYGSKTLFDAEIGYRFASVDLAIGVRNLFDTYPDSPSSQVIVDAFGDRSMDFNNNFGTFPWAAASPFGYNGRYLYARAEMTLLK